MPPIQTTRREPGLWRGTPPAIFPPILGLIALGLGWRRAGDAFGFGPQPSDLGLGAVSLLFAFAFLAYAAKVAQRTAVIEEDLRALPGRAGLAAMTMSVMLMAVVMLRYAPGAAVALLWVGLALHAGLALMILRQLAAGPPEQRRVTPAWHLSFAGFIVAPVAAVPLGFPALAMAIFGFTLALAVVVWAVSARQFAQASVPAPLRPLLAIHVAPAALFATVGAELDLPLVAEVYGLAALAGVVALAASARWMTAGGFTPMWGAFTFPLAATASSALALSEHAGGPAWRAAGALVLVVATLAIPPIAAKVLQAWAKGQLGPRTGASVA